MSKTITLLAAITALTATPVSSEEEGVTQLTALQRDLPRLRELAQIVGTELGVTELAQLPTKLREMKTQLAQLTADVAAARKAKVETIVDATMKKYENRLTVPLRTSLGMQLTTELTAGVELEKSETVKVLESLPVIGAFQQRGNADTGAALTGTDEEKINARAKQLISEDPEIKQLTAKSFSAGLREATKRATRELTAK